MPFFAANMVVSMMKKSGLDLGFWGAALLGFTRHSTAQNNGDTWSYNDN